MNVFAFDFNKANNFEEVKEEFMNSIQKINEKNFKQILEMHQFVPFVGEISVLLEYYFLKVKSENQAAPEGLLIKFTTSLG